MRSRRRAWVRGLSAGAMLALATVLTSAAPVAGQGRPIDIAVEHAPHLQSQPNFVRLEVRVTYADTGEPPVTDEEFFVLAEGQLGEVRTESYGCAPRTIIDNRAPNGVYDCSVIVDRGGPWTFTVVVNAPTIPGEVPVRLGQQQISFEVEAPTLRGLTGDERIEGSVFDVGLALVHTWVAAAWFGAALCLVALSLPRARRMLSDRARHHMEVHLPRIVAVLWSSAVLVAGTGLYLTATAAAYEAPWSVDDARALFRLPYAQPYFLSLWAKIGIFALLIAATIVLVREARRRTRLADEAVVGPGPGRQDAPSPWDRSPRASVPDADPGAGPGVERAGGGVATVPPIELVGPEQATPEDDALDRPVPGVTAGRLVTVASGLLPLGAFLIGICVALLVYFHVLIEAALADL